MLDITLASNCYEKNYKLITSDCWINKMFLKDNSFIRYRNLLVSNINDRNPVIERLDRLIHNGIIDSFYFSYDYLDEIEKAFLNCNRDSFYRTPSKREWLSHLIRGDVLKTSYDGLLYSISQITAILTCKSRYLLFITEDVTLDDKTLADWVTKAIKLMEIDSNILVANPLWNNAINEASREAIREDDDFWYSYGFSDQCCLLDVKKIMSIPNIFGEKNKETEVFYPYYAGNHFERRIAAYMRNHGLYRIIYKHASYDHKDISDEELVSGKRDDSRIIH